MTISLSLQAFLFSLFSFIILVIFIRTKLFQSKPKKNLPPSPPRLPIIGNFHQLGSSSLQVLSQKHGPIMLLYFGSVPTLVASSAKVAEEIMKTHDLSFSSRPSSPIPNILLYGSNDIGFSPYGEYWRQLKSIVVVHLLSNTRVNSYRQVRENETCLLIDKLGESCGFSVDIRFLLNSLSNNIICRVALGGTYDASKPIDLLRKFVDILTVFNVGTYIPWLSWVDRLSNLEGRAKKLAKELDEFLEGVVEDHVKQRTMVDAKNGDGKDLVDIFLDIQRDDTNDFTLHKDSLKGVIWDMFAAGTETTSTSLEWTISELVKHPTIMKKLQQEVTEIAKGRSTINEEDLEKMQYLKAVTKESLRLHPPLPLLLPRESTQDVIMMGYDIPSGTQVIINAWAIGRDPAKWEEPDEFKPERFLNSLIEYKGVNFGWLPFGGGRRGCPGIQFGVVVMELALANIVYKFDLALPDGLNCRDLDMSEVCGMTLQRKSPLTVIATPRFSG